MTPIAFSDLLAAIQMEESRVLDTKANEYAGDGDRLWNFKRAAGLLGTTPEAACWGFLAKHLVSIGDLVDAPDRANPQMWREKIGDARNYLALLEALFVERHG